MSRRTKPNSQLLALLNAIDAYQRAHGYAPTVRELAAQAGVSRSVVFYHLRKLELAKLVESDFYKARSLRITEAGCALLEGETMTRGVTGRVAAKRDANEAEIVGALTRVGATVHRLSGRGLPDLLVGFRGQTYLLEVKAPKDAALTDSERAFFEAWQGSGGAARIVRTADEALAAVGALEG